MRTTVRAGAAAAVLLAPWAVGTASAQQVLHAPDQIRACLCEQQSVKTLAEVVQQQSRVYEQRRQALEALDKEVSTKRPQVNVANQSDVDAFKHLLDERDAAADSFAGEVTQTYADAVRRYNQAVSTFNANCSGKAYDPQVLAQVQNNLSCPKP